MLMAATPSQPLVPLLPCNNSETLQTQVVEVVRFSQSDRRSEFDRLVSPDVSMNIWIGDQGFGVRSDSYGVRALGDARSQVMKQLKSWELNRYAVRRSGIVCSTSESVGIELISDDRKLSLFLTFDFKDGRLFNIGGEGFFVTEFALPGQTNG
jgi:hypothetical protein